MVFPYLALWHHHRTRDTSIVTSYSSIVLARANWCEGDLHKWITIVNIDFSPPGFHGFACKNYKAFTLCALFVTEIGSGADEINHWARDKNKIRTWVRILNIPSWYGDTWNNCLCTLWPSLQSSLTLFACIPNFAKAVIQILMCPSIVKEGIAE